MAMSSSDRIVLCDGQRRLLPSLCAGSRPSAIICRIVRSVTPMYAPACFCVMYGSAVSELLRFNEVRPSVG
jgi:hypothetical protein